MNPFANPSYLLPPLIAASLCLVLLIIVVSSKGYRDVAHRLFSVFLLATGLWGIFIFIMRSSPTVQQALPWDRAVAAIILISTALFYHFTLAYSNTKEKKGLVPATYAFIGLAIILAPTNLIIDHMELESYGYAYISGPLLYPMASFGYFLMAMGVYNLFKSYRASTRYEERNRYLYITIAASFPVIGTMVDFFPSIYPMAITGNVVFCLLTATAILKYHLLDITLAIRRGTAYLLMSVLIAIPYGGIIIGVSLGLKAQFPVWGYMLMIIVLAFAITPLWQKVQDRVDRLFYRERYDYLKGLEEFGQQMRSIIELDSLASSTIDMIINAMQVRHACLLMPSTETGDYTVVAFRGLPNATTQYRIENDSLFVRWLEREKRFLHSREIDVIPQLQALRLNDLEVLYHLEGELYIPLSVQDRLTGILVLGPKLSQQLFTTRDLQLLSAVSSQIAMSLENARLYQREKQRAGELAMLQRSSVKLASELDLDLLCQKVVEETARLLQADAAALFNIESENQSMVLRAATGLTDSYAEGLKIPLSTVIPQELWDDFSQDNTAIIVNDVTASAINRLEFIEKEDIRSMLEIPVVESGRLVNVLAIFSLHYPRHFTDEDLNMARTFARHAVLAMENARLYGVERQQRMELERLDEMRSDFFIAVSHELKTPLTAIKGAGEIIIDGQGLDLDSPQGHLFSIINRNVQRMENRIQELLDFVKIQSDTLQLGLKNEDICQAIEEATSLNLPTLWTRKQDLKLKLLNTTTTVMLDRNRFEQILTNLLTNASKYSPQDSEINVEARVADSEVIIDVSDQGRGIPLELHEKIFEPYFRAEHNTTGLGIGLNIARKLTELHGGRMWVNQRDGGGTIFSFSLPITSN